MAAVNAFSRGPEPEGTASGSPYRVRLEVRQGNLAPTLLEVPATGFLVGSVPGCDLRLSGTGLPAVVALITPGSQGPLLRKLIPTGPLQRNNRPAASGLLAHGDRLTFGQTELIVQVEAAASAPVTPSSPHTIPLDEERRFTELAALRKAQADYQADLVHLHRREAALESRLQDVARREEATAQAEQRLGTAQDDAQRRTQHLEQEEARQRAEAERLRRERAEADAALVELAQRSSAVEGQQAVLTALRTRLERLRDDLRAETQQAAEQRARQAAAEADLNARLHEAERLRAAFDAENQTLAEERRQFAERSAVMEQALAQFREVQANLEQEEARLRDRTQLLNAAADQQAEEASILGAKAAQLVALQQRLAADRLALREREQALTKAEQVRESLQEQLRRRSEDLILRQQELTEQAHLHTERLAELEQERAALRQRQQDEAERTKAAQHHLEAQAAELAGQQAELRRQEASLGQQHARLQAAGRRFAGARKAFWESRQHWETAQRRAAEAEERRKEELEHLRQQVLALQEQLPELELRGQAAQQRLTAAREQLRGHLTELHHYAQQAREDLAALRIQVQAEADQVRQQELALHRAREEHRLAVASFRQHLLDWQSQVADRKRTLAHDETRLERRAAKVEKITRQIDAAATDLTQRAEQVAEQERRTAERRLEVEQHLDDMREWYRRKLRELAQGQEQTPKSGESHAPMHLLPPSVEYEEGDQQFGTLLRQLGLVDQETLGTLLTQAQRQRRSLRQLLLAGGHLTLYQLALIETGNLGALMLGPVRVIDRVRTTPHETIYRIFDPRRGQEAILRHLSEADAEDAVRPDEFRQRFAQAATIRHPNVAATWEVLEVAGRPAVLQEALAGLPGTDWPPLTGTAGVWYRLLHRTALGLHAAHEVGLVHGRLYAGSLLLTEEGVLKVCGLGEPPWLRTPAVQDADDDAAGDLAALGRLAAAWAAAAQRRQGRPLPDPLAAVLQRLIADNTDLRYPSMAALVEHLEQLGLDVPDAGPAWKRFLRAIHELPDDEEVRQSA